MTAERDEAEARLQRESSNNAGVRISQTPTSDIDSLRADL